MPCVPNPDPNHPHRVYNACHPRGPRHSPRADKYNVVYVHKRAMHRANCTNGLYARAPHSATHRGIPHLLRDVRTHAAEAGKGQSQGGIPPAPPPERIATAPRTPRACTVRFRVRVRGRVRVRVRVRVRA